jgi:hypothetical protein
MKLTTIALATALVLSNTVAFAQAGVAGASGAGAAAVPERSGEVNGSTSARTTGNSTRSGSSSGSAITTGSGAPQDNPNLSSSSQTSDTSRKAK